MRTARLGDHVAFLSGFAFKSNCFNTDGNGLPIVRIRDVLSGMSDTFYSGDYDDRYVVHRGDCLIGMDGEFNLAYWQSGKALLNQRVCKIDQVSPEIDRGYLARFLTLALKQIEAVTPFVTVKHLSVKTLSDTLIPLPPLPVQKRIAAILDAADALRAKRRESIEQLDSLVQATFLEMFGDPVTNPKGWGVSTLGEACLGKPAYGSSTPATEYEPALPRYVRITDISESGQLGDDRKSAALSPEDVEQYRLKQGDLLFARSGATVGKTYLYRQSDGPCVYAGYLIRFCPNPSVLLPEVLFRFTKTRSYWRWIESVARAVAQPNINAKMYAGLTVMTPPLDLQTGFASIVKSIEQQKAQLKAHLAELDTLFASLQSRAFNGELVA
jgi:type I restriction enzyme S subunit